MIFIRSGEMIGQGIYVNPSHIIAIQPIDHTKCHVYLTGQTKVEAVVKAEFIIDKIKAYENEISPC